MLVQDDSFIQIQTVRNYDIFKYGFMKEVPFKHASIIKYRKIFTFYEFISNSKRTLKNEHWGCTIYPRSSYPFYIVANYIKKRSLRL